MEISMSGHLSTQALTAPEVEALEDGGFELDSVDLGEEDPLLKTAAEYAALVKSGLTTKAAADRLRVAPSRIRQRLTSRPPTLYGIRLESGWRIPEFQFQGDDLLQGISEVVSALDSELHPISVYRWFMTPSPDLTVEDRPVSPRDWLRSGQAVAEITSLATDLP
jgi:hypothetical protein